ncbi:hypothetical protein BD560DRAFT_332717 [Blakeslea trispora]|nr:hypothetical protein BD560DRAFT_332717 [Blakeslea trispora]
MIDERISIHISMCMINEFSTSQACVFFCFEEINHSLRIVQKDGKESSKTINSTFICSNKTYILNLAKQSHKPGDSLSALAINISGVYRLIGSKTLDVFNPST